MVHLFIPRFYPPIVQMKFPIAQQEVTKSHVGEWLTQKIPSPWEDLGFTIDTKIGHKYLILDKWLNTHTIHI